jgi:hypothetical protein
MNMNFTRFTRLLAAGRSVMGIKRHPGPYRMNQDHLLPRFDPPRRLGRSLVGSPEAEPGQASSAAAAASGGGKSRNLLARVVARFIHRKDRRQGNRPAAARTGGGPVQTELSLADVRVVRNDLTDSDFDIVAGRGGKGANGRPALGLVWNRLSARLLRQAAQEFKDVQKERGKFLSQASSGDGGPGGA